MPAGAKPYSPPSGEHTAGAVRRATDRAFHRHLDQQVAAEQAAATKGVKVPAVEHPTRLLADELTRQVVPNRTERRAHDRALRHAGAKQRQTIAKNRRVWEQREAKRRAKAGAVATVAAVQAPTPAAPAAGPAPATRRGLLGREKTSQVQSTVRRRGLLRRKAA